MIEEMEGQMSIFDQDIWCGKMSPEPSAVTKPKTSASSSKKSQKSATKMPLFLCLKAENGQQADASWQIGGALLGEYAMHSFTESPKEGVESHLSQILEVNPHPKYSLSDKACLGILTRARRRGKQLPPMLEEALIQMVVGGTEYGQEGIADTVEILRKMRCEIGEEALKEWVQRTFVLVQSEEVLLGEMCESCEDSEDSNERVMVEGDSEEVDAEEDLCELWDNGEVGDTPQRPQPNEQLCRELDLLMQKLPHENAPKAVIMYCLRIACESEESLSETLPTTPQGESLGANDRLGADQYNAVILGDTVSTLGVNCGMSHGRQCILEPQTAYTLQDREGKAGGGKGALIAEELSATLRAGFAQTLFQPVYSVENHPADSTECVVKAFPEVNYNQFRESNTELATLKARGGTCGDGSESLIVAAVDCSNCTENSEINGTLQAHMSGGSSLNLNNVVRVKYIVRRLTPLECERLQGYPDGWTDIGDWVDSKGKVHKTSDAARYKALGNSIALPPWKWVLKRLCACYERDATMASLFDGIGGFPLIWEQLNGKGTCLWASEIEEFPIAVTKVRIGE